MVNQIDHIEDLQSFNWPVLIWPILVAVFVILFFRVYIKAVYLEDVCHPPTHKEKKKRSTASPPPTKSSLMRPGRMTKRDWLLALVLTVIYSIFAFPFSGNVTSPQTFWRATKEYPSMTLDLGEEVRLDNILYFTGLGDGDWVLELSTDGKTWRMQKYVMTHPFDGIFTWLIPPLVDQNSMPTRYLRLTADFRPYREDYQLVADTGFLELGELVLITLDENGDPAAFDMASLSVRHPQYAALFDEQSLVPTSSVYGSQAIYDHTWGRLFDQNYGMFFDENLHARTAYEYIRGLAPAEITHPPLGKAIIALGIEMFGMTPFGWRFMGILFGVLMLPLLYVFVKNMFDNTTAAACGTALLAFENMHFTQTHVATIDTYVVFFILAMYLFMYRYISSGYDTPFVKTLPPLFLCGFAFGLGAASKWTALYAALGLIVLYVTYLAKRGKHQATAGQRKEYHIFLLQTLAASVGFFVIIPFAIYTLSYIPYTAALGHPLTVGNLIGDMWENAKYMLWYHGQYMSENVNYYESRWWQWLLDIRPFLYQGMYPEGSRAIIAAFTNPLVTIGGLAAMGIAIWDLLRKKVKEALVVVIGFLAQLSPWFLVSRTTYAYHYFPSTIFLILAICYVFKNILEHTPEHRRRVYLFTGMSVVLFFLLLPPTVGLQMPDWYAQWVVRWLPSWPF